VVSFKPWLLYPLRSSLRYTLRWRLGRVQSRSGHSGEEKNSFFCPCRESKPVHLTHSLVTVFSEDGGSIFLRNIGILPQHYTMSQLSEDGGSKVLRNVGILPHHYTVSQPSEDGGSKVLRNVGILPHHYTASQPNEDGGRKSSETLVSYHITTRCHYAEDILSSYLCIVSVSITRYPESCEGH
jgi:hypothetical protein